MIIRFLYTHIHIIWMIFSPLFHAVIQTQSDILNQKKKKRIIEGVKDV